MLSYFSTPRTRSSPSTPVPFLNSLITSHHYKTLNYFSDSPDAENVLIRTYDEGDLVIVRTLQSSRNSDRESAAGTIDSSTRPGTARRMATLTAPYQNAMRIGELPCDSGRGVEHETMWWDVVR